MEHPDFYRIRCDGVGMSADGWNNMVGVFLRVHRWDLLSTGLGATL